jgi:hypothetical protein
MGIAFRHQVPIQTRPRLCLLYIANRRRLKQYGAQLSAVPDTAVLRTAVLRTAVLRTAAARPGTEMLAFGGFSREAGEMPTPAHEHARQIIRTTLHAHGLTDADIRHIHIDEHNHITVAIDGIITQNVPALDALQNDVAHHLREASLTPPFDAVVSIPFVE